ncbi:hypothetical protein [Paraburkholderia sediminicola]
MSKDRALSLPGIRLSLRLILLTLVRKSDLVPAMCNEIDSDSVK